MERARVVVSGVESCFWKLGVEEISLFKQKMCDRLVGLQNVVVVGETLVATKDDEAIYAFPKNEFGSQLLDLIQYYNELSRINTPCMSTITEAIECDQVPGLPNGEYQVLFEQISQLNLADTQISAENLRVILFQVVWTLFIFSRYSVQLSKLEPSNIQLFDNKTTSNVCSKPRWSCLVHIASLSFC